MQRKEPFPGKIFTPCVPERRFAGLFGCIARISCHSQLISDAWRANLAANWRFSRSRPLSGCMERKICHGLPPGNAFREYFAIGKRPGTHRGGILSRQGPRERIARVYCHCQSGQERIRAQSRHRRTLGNASREHFAIVERPGNAYSQRLANGAASSCGRAYCLAIALVPHESDGLFVQAVLRTRERGALSRTWRGALNAGIRAEGADDKLAHALRQTGLHPSCRPTWAPSTNRPQHRCETRNESAGQANIERLRETDLRDRRKNGISGNDVHRPAAGSQGGFARRNSPE